MKWKQASTQWGSCLSASEQQPKGSQKLCLLVIIQVLRLWASRGVFIKLQHSKSSWQFSNSASVRWWLQAGGIGGVVEECSAVNSMPDCSLTWHRIRSSMKMRHMKVKGVQMCYGALWESWPVGDTSHSATPCLFTMPVCDPVSCSRGCLCVCTEEGGGVQCPLLFWNSLSGISKSGIIHMVGGVQSASSKPWMRNQALRIMGAHLSGPPHSSFQSVCELSSMSKQGRK